MKHRYCGYDYIGAVLASKICEPTSGVFMSSRFLKHHQVIFMYLFTNSKYLCVVEHPVDNWSSVRPV